MTFRLLGNSPYGQYNLNFFFFFKLFDVVVVVLAVYIK